ncbi:MAG: alpha/beta hydrolase [Isosphaeraceae bacterium]|nr:alpha/beta hydrolase [Isosphaeraceae bacterium]
MNPRIVVAIVLSWSFTVRAADEPKPSDNVKTEYDVVYAKVGDTELKLDIARPAGGSGAYPAVLAIHGGAWRTGNKADMRPLLLELARRGFVAVSPQYRFCPKETFPAQVHDLKAAVRFVKSHAKDYQLDPDRVGAMGFSAGAHLAMMLGVTGPEDGLEGEAAADAPSSKVRAVVNYFGPTDLRADDIPPVSRGLVKDFLGGTVEEKPEAAAKASPITFVNQGDAPILSFQGTKDPLVPHTQATKLADAQTKAGVPGRVELLVGFGHGWAGDDLVQTAEETYGFFKKHLKP